jgi:hypothetical protein
MNDTVAGSKISSSSVVAVIGKVPLQTNGRRLHQRCHDDDKAESPHDMTDGNSVLQHGRDKTTDIRCQPATIEHGQQLLKPLSQDGGSVRCHGSVKRPGRRPVLTHP